MDAPDDHTATPPPAKLRSIMSTAIRMIHVSPATVVLMTGALLASGLSAPGMAADILTPINIRHVKVHGEIGRRIDITINNNVMVLKADQDGADLGQITLDPQSLGEPVADDSVRPDGLACLVRAWKPGYTCARPGNLKLKLTEFTDPDGRATYFRLQDFRVATDDELFHGPSNGALVPAEQGTVEDTTRLTLKGTP